MHGKYARVVLRVLTLAVAACAQAAEPDVAPLREVVQTAVDTGRIAGGGLLVIHEGSVLIREGFGYADVEAKKPFTPEALCMIGSVSKPVLATAMMILADQERVDLDTSVSGYLSIFDGVPPFTTRQLLAHTSGIFGNDSATPAQMALLRDMDSTLESVVKRIAEYPFVAAPGAEYHYSGAGYCVAGRVAEVACGKPLEQIMQETLVAPLGMNSTTFFPSEGARVAAPERYLQEQGELVKQAKYPGELTFALPGGSLHSTLDDLGTLGRMHLHNGQFDGSRILSEALAREMRRPHSAGERDYSYGLGWQLPRAPGGVPAPLQYHGGAWGAQFWIDHERDVVGVFLMHGAANQVQDIWQELRDTSEKVFEVTP